MRKIVKSLLTLIEVEATCSVFGKLKGSIVI